MGCQGSADRSSEIDRRFEVDRLRKADAGGAADAIATTKIMLVLLFPSGEGGPRNIYERPFGR